ncbi:hypothetical protein [Azotobacter beijerinckii]|uniref:hypothetical protein n=1 Tax=Azotobacter beijerinckii TaxID=170623 RepID=UPI0029540A2C|nr:hypothetical protein [Azotobacter beijerinckii]MDV7209913.1 hypothetical protein [Azotobacter beijerinckii]
MKWLIALIVAVVLGFPAVFTAGVVVGLEVAAEKKPTETLKNVIGSAGDWVSGLGSLAAAAVAVYLADRQRRANTPKIEVNQYITRDIFTIDIISTGEKDAVVRGVYIRSSKLKKQAMISRPPLVEPKDLPWRLEYGDVRRISIDRSRYFAVAMEIGDELEEYEFTGLQIVVGTSTVEFKVDLNEDFQAALKEHFEKPLKQ